MEREIGLHSTLLQKERHRPWIVSYVSLTNFRTGPKRQKQTFEKKINVLFETFRLLSDPVTDILFGCHKGGISRKEVEKSFGDTFAYEMLESFDRKGSFCIRTRNLEELTVGFKAVWTKSGLGNLFLVFGPQQIDIFLKEFSDMQKFRGTDFYSFASGFSDRCDFITASYDSNMIDIYSAKLSIEEIENAVFQAARANHLEVAREKNE